MHLKFLICEIGEILTSDERNFAYIIYKTIESEIDILKRRKKISLNFD